MAMLMLERPAADPLWAREYQNYVQQVSYAEIDQLISFDQALAAVRDLVALIPGGSRT
jgi:hypothetical protein